MLHSLNMDMLVEYRHAELERAGARSRGWLNKLVGS
jgi:hypothetical protein